MYKDDYVQRKMWICHIMVGLIGLIVIPQGGLWFTTGIYWFIAGVSSIYCYSYCLEHEPPKTSMIWWSIILAWYLFWFLMPLYLFGPKYLKAPILIFSKIAVFLEVLVLSVILVGSVVGVL